MDELCKQITLGVYVIAVTDGQHESAFTAAWVMQVSFAPLLLAFSINPLHSSYALLKTGKRCTVNILARQQRDVAAHFGRSGVADKMAGFQWQKSNRGVPVLADSLGYFDCTVSHINCFISFCTVVSIYCVKTYGKINTAPAGDHELVVCNVLEAVCLNSGEPMQYRDTGNMDGRG